MKKTKTVQTVISAIDGLEDFPLEALGLTPESIEKSNGHIKIPIELLPYIKICKTPVLSRKQKAKTQYRYLLKLRAKESKHATSRITKRGGVK